MAEKKEVKYIIPPCKSCVRDPNPRKSYPMKEKLRGLDDASFCCSHGAREFGKICDIETYESAGFGTQFRHVYETADELYVLTEVSEQRIALLRETVTTQHKTIEELILRVDMLEHVLKLRDFDAAPEEERRKRYRREADV